jgi:hypothetical protein
MSYPDASIIGDGSTNSTKTHVLTTLQNKMLSSQSRHIGTMNLHKPVTKANIMSLDEMASTPALRLLCDLLPWLSEGIVISPYYPP